jgi:hypothetical protein
MVVYKAWSIQVCIARYWVLTVAKPAYYPIVCLFVSVLFSESSLSSL